MPVKCTCKQCGKVFSVAPSKINRKVFCSIKCYSAARRVVLIKTICRQCGKEFAVYPSVIRKGHGKFCSITCAHKSKELPGNRSGTESPFWKGGKSTTRMRIWKNEHINPIRFKPISTEELNVILQGDDEK